MGLRPGVSMCQIQLLPLCKSSRDKHLPGSWNELPVIFSHWNQLKQITQCFIRGKSYYSIRCEHLLFCPCDCKCLDIFVSSFSLKPSWQLTIFWFLFFYSIRVPVLPSPLPAFLFPPSVSGTRSTTGSRAWRSVCTGTWGRSRTTSAQRTRSSEAVSTIFKVFFKVSRTPKSWF